MENLTLTLIVFTNVLLVIILGALVFLAWRFLKTKEGQASKEQAPGYHPAVLERMREAEKLKVRKPGLFCPNHPDEPGETQCAICDRLFCKACIRPFKSLHFCKEHLPLIMRHEWDEVLTLKTSTTDPEQGVRLYDRKKELFETEDLPTYVETHYKINVDQDYIETYLVLFAIKERLDEVRSRFANL